MKRQKTFEEDTEAGVAECWVADIINDLNTTILKDRDPAEWKYYTTDKMKITIEIFDNNIL